MKKRTCLLAWTIIVLKLTDSRALAQSIYEPYTFTTLSGSADPGIGSMDGTGNDARLNNPFGVAVDSASNVYVADACNHTIRKVTPAGVVTTLAGLAGTEGSADGTRSAARFSYPGGVAVDSGGNVYVADAGNNNTIRKVTPDGVVTTLAGLAGAKGSEDGTGSAARFGGYPSGVAVDSVGNVYVSDQNNSTIRKVTPDGVVTTLAGQAGTEGSADGTGSVARFSYPGGVAVDSGGNVYVADAGNSTIRKVTSAGVVTTLAGLAGTQGTADGTGSAARFTYPGGVAVDNSGNVYVADSPNHTIRKVTQAGLVTTLAGLAGNAGSGDGTGNAARFNFPRGVAADSAGNVYVADLQNSTIRQVTAAGVVRTFAGRAPSAGSADGTGSIARFNHPFGVAVDSASNLYVADSWNHTLRKVTPAGVVATLAGNASITDQNGNFIGGYADGTGSAARFNYPSGVAVDSASNLYVADTYNHTIRKVTPAGEVTTLAGLAQLDANGDPAGGSADGTGSAARFLYPIGVAVDSAGNVYVADSGNKTIRKVTPEGLVTTLAGLAGNFGSADGTGSSARFAGPSGVAVDSAGNVYVADSFNNTIRKVTPAGVVTTLAGLAQLDVNGYPVGGSADGTGSAARFGQCIVVFHTCGLPTGVAVDSAGNVYVADSGNNTIRKVTPDGAVTTLAGLAGYFRGEGMGESADGTGSAARFDTPQGVAVDSAGNLYVADTFNHTIRKGYPSPPRILNAGPGIGFNGGQFGFNLTGPSGHLVVVEASTDLASWLPLWTNTFTFQAALHFSDPQSGASSHRFYRARLP